MAFFSDLEEHIGRVRGALGEGIVAADVPGAVAGMEDEAVVELLREASAIVKAGEMLRIAASGVAARRSQREHGHGGLAQTRGHGSPISLVQELTGATKSEASRHVRLGAALLDTVPEAASDDETVADALPRPWHAPLSEALLTGVLTGAQHDAILRGLGEPPTLADADELTLRGFDEAWSLAASQLADEAQQRTVEELARAARTVRDVLDPEGAARRFDERFERRAFRMWTDADGVRRGTIVFDDDSGLWVQAIIDSALRPRRGGPRFVDPDEKQRAEQLAGDPRTNEQLTYDLVLDTLRAGALAEADAVFGTRQAGVRLVMTKDAAAAVEAGDPAIAIVEDDGTALPAWLAVQHACATGTSDCSLDRDGNPLYLGREARLFSSAQKVALAIRDGGCRWRGCDKPASYCESHHIDHWCRDNGRTDVDRGILLCRFHHMQLHHGDWRITRDGLGEFVLHPPPGRGDPIVLEQRLARRYAWGDLDPPPRRFRPAA